MKITKKIIRTLTIIILMKFHFLPQLLAEN